MGEYKQRMQRQLQLLTVCKMMKQIYTFEIHENHLTKNEAYTAARKVEKTFSMLSVLLSACWLKAYSVPIVNKSLLNDRNTFENEPAAFGGSLIELDDVL